MNKNEKQISPIPSLAKEGEISENIHEERNILKKIFAGIFFRVFCFGSGLKVEFDSPHPASPKGRGDTDSQNLGRIFVANHQQFFDLVWLGFGIRKYLKQVSPTPSLNKEGKNPQCYFLVHRHNFEALSWRILSWWLPIFYVDLDDENLLKKLGEILTNGDSVFLFPEGTYNLCCEKNRQLLPFYHGASNLALESGADVVPVGISSFKKISPPSPLLNQEGKNKFNSGLFQFSPFPASGKSALKILWYFFSGRIFGRKVFLRFGEEVTPSSFLSPSNYERDPSPTLPYRQSNSKSEGRPNPVDFGEVKKFTETLEKSVADLAGLEVSRMSELQDLCKFSTPHPASPSGRGDTRLFNSAKTQEKIRGILKNMGVYCAGDIFLHWRSAGILEKIWECGGRKRLEIFLPEDCVIGEKIYLCPNQKIAEKNLGKNKVVGDWGKMERYLT